MTRWVLLVGLLAGCKKQAEAPPKPPSAIPQTELKRGEDACGDYVKKICACDQAVAKAKDQCGLAQGYPEAIKVGMMTVTNMNSKNTEVLDAAEAVRKTFKTCIEEAQQLAATGCPK